MWLWGSRTRRGGAGGARAGGARGAGAVRGARGRAEAAGISADVSVTDLLRLPGVITVEDAEEEDGEAAVLLKTAGTDAVDGRGRVRQPEAAALARDLGTHVDALGAWVRQVANLLPSALARIQAR